MFYFKRKIMFWLSTLTILRIQNSFPVITWVQRGGISVSAMQKGMSCRRAKQMIMMALCKMRLLGTSSMESNPFRTRENRFYFAAFQIHIQKTECVSPPVYTYRTMSTAHQKMVQNDQKVAKMGLIPRADPTHFSLCLGHDEK